MKSAAHLLDIGLDPLDDLPQPFGAGCAFQLFFHIVELFACRCDGVGQLAEFLFDILRQYLDVGNLSRRGKPVFDFPNLPAEICILHLLDGLLQGLDLRRDAPIKQLIDRTGKEGDTLGGIVEVRVDGVPFGLGTHTQWHRKLDGRLAQAVMAVQAIKGVEIGMGFETARLPGSRVHDPIHYVPERADTPTLGYERPSNNAGGLEAGMTNGQPIVIRAAKKPISTLRKSLASINLKTKQTEEASYERSDVCAVSAASVIVENVVAFEIATAMVEKFGGDSLREMQARYELFLKLARDHWES